MKPWEKVGSVLGVAPVVEGWIGGETRLYAQRYVHRAVKLTFPGIEVLMLLTQIGGSRVQEDGGGETRLESIPTQSALLPADTPTHWNYSGPVDFAAFFFAPGAALPERFRFLSQAAKGPVQFNDNLVSATALQITNELRKGDGADTAFMAQLSMVMLEQTYRVLTRPGTGGLVLSHAHGDRLQIVLNHIQEHLAGDLSAETLAGLAQVSLPHFRRLFQEATGEPPHRYVLAARLEKARTLLTSTSLPIARIALDCGFSSQSHLTASFRAAHAASPATFRAAHTKR